MATLLFVISVHALLAIVPSAAGIRFWVHTSQNSTSKCKEIKWWEFHKLLIKIVTIKNILKHSTFSHAILSFFWLQHYGWWQWYCMATQKDKSLSYNSLPRKICARIHNLRTSKLGRSHTQFTFLLPHVSRSSENLYLHIWHLKEYQHG